MFAKSLTGESVRPFRDRFEAGKLLATRLTQYSDRTAVHVFALPRGGLPVAFEIAQAIHAPLDIFLVRKLGVPDLTTTVLTLTITGLAADSSLAHGSNPRWQRRLASVLAMFAGATMGVIILRRSVFAALGFAVVVSSVCCVALLSSLRWSSQVQASMTAEQHRV